MRDPRLEHYARILVDTCLAVQPGWQVLVSAPYLARPLVEEISAQLGARGAYVLVRQNLTGSLSWLMEAPDELLKTPPEIEVHTLETADALISISAPENTREASAVPAEKIGLIQSGFRPHLQRVYANEMPWVGCNYPTPALAQDAGMSLRDYEDFLYGACLLDWDAERERVSRYAERTTPSTTTGDRSTVAPWVPVTGSCRRSTSARWRFICKKRLSRSLMYMRSGMALSKVLANSRSSPRARRMRARSTA